MKRSHYGRNVIVFFVFFLILFSLLMIYYRDVTKEISGRAILFISPSPSEGQTTESSVILNVSITEDNVTYSFFNDSLYGWYRFDNDSGVGENNGIVYDWSGRGNNGEVNGAFPNSSGEFAGAYSFDGIDDYIDLGSNLGLGYIETKSVWINTRDNLSANNQTVVSADGDTHFIRLLNEKMCSGTPSTGCSGWDGNQTACELFNRHSFYCTWNVPDAPFCEGIQGACSDYSGTNQSYCEERGCAWDFADGGTNNTCYGQYDLCHQFDLDGNGCNNYNPQYCQWNGADSCDNIDSPYGYECSFFDADQMLCESTSCDWNFGNNGTCTGDLTCDTQTFGDACEFVDGCSSSLSTKVSVSSYNNNVLCIVNSTNSISTNNWHHIVSTNNGSLLSLYIDGVLESSRSHTCPIAPSNISIGRGNSGGYFNGSIDELLFFNRSISLTEVRALYNSSQYYLQRNLTGLSGSQSYTVKSINSLGELNSSTLFFYADSDYPLISYGFGTENNLELTDLSSIYINISAYDSNEMNLTFNLFNASGIVNSTTLSFGNRSINFTNLVAGTYTYNVSITDIANRINHTSNRNITILPSCLDQCNEGEYCSIAQSCYLYSDLCTEGVCNFNRLDVSVFVYTLYNSSGDGRNIDLNVSNASVRSALNFYPNSAVVFKGKNGSTSFGTRGGHAGVINITVPDLFNTTYALFIGSGGYSTDAVSGGDGGIIQLNYKGLIHYFDDADNELPNNSPLLKSGNSSSQTSGINGSLVLNKNLNVAIRDADVDNDGYVGASDYIALKSRYRNISTDASFSVSFDIKPDNVLDIKDLIRIGLEINSR